MGIISFKWYEELLIVHPKMIAGAIQHRDHPYIYNISCHKNTKFMTHLPILTVQKNTIRIKSEKYIWIFKNWCISEIKFYFDPYYLSPSKYFSNICELFWNIKIEMCLRSFLCILFSKVSWEILLAVFWNTHMRESVKKVDILG